jgi:hypothetical protein
MTLKREGAIYEQEIFFANRRDTRCHTCAFREQSVLAPDEKRKEEEGRPCETGERVCWRGNGKTSLLYCPTQAHPGNYTVPVTVTSIERGAFYNCTELTGVTIPNSQGWFEHTLESFAPTGTELIKGVSTIGSYAFSGCTNLESVPFTITVTMEMRCLTIS